VLSGFVVVELDYGVDGTHVLCVKNANIILIFCLGVAWEITA